MQETIRNCAGRGRSVVYDLEEQYKCVAREIAIRERVYPKWVETGRMKQIVANREIDCMRAVLETLANLIIPLDGDFDDKDFEDWPATRV